MPTFTKWARHVSVVVYVGFAAARLPAALSQQTHRCGGAGAGAASDLEGLRLRELRERLLDLPWADIKDQCAVYRRPPII